jgi:NAD(P)-dependent dehydrogenase (short-subunit alcohol dehydrogenase family)
MLPGFPSHHSHHKRRGILAFQSMSLSNGMLHGKVAVVTGSSAGIGAAIARELASHGASVVVNYPYRNLKDEADDVLKSLNTTSIAVEADLSTREGPIILIEAAVKQFSKIDILVNNASVAIFKPLELCTEEEWDKMINLNGRGYLLTTKAVLPHLNNPSRIVNITSSDCRFPTPSHSIYAGTKGMQDAFTRIWAKELPPKYGCTVNSVVPGATRYGHPTLLLVLLMEEPLHSKDCWRTRRIMDTTRYKRC